MIVYCDPNISYHIFELWMEKWRKKRKEKTEIFVIKKLRQRTKL